MNRILIILAVTACLLHAGCTDDRIDLPGVKASPSRLDLNSDHTTDQILLSVSAPLNLEWNLSYKPDWLEVNPTSGFVNGTSIVVTALTGTLLPQTLTDKIVFTTTSGKVEVPVTLVITRSAAIQLTPSPLLLDYNENSKTVTLKNNSNQSASWQLDPSQPWLTISPSSGTLNANQSVTLTLSVNRATLETNIYTETLTLKLAGVVNSTIPVSINNYKNDMWILEGEVTDAEYSRSMDNLVVIIGSKLFKLKPETKTTSSVLLPLAGNCVSVSTDGKYAVVGHDAWVSLVDLVAMKIDKTYPVSTNALDIVFAPNNWAYVFPKADQWTYIRCINLIDGTEVLQTGRQIYAGTKGKLHPSGKYIYGTNNGLSPSDAEKYDIQEGQARFLYDSPYHGDYAFSGNLWMADDGSRMFTRSRNVFRLSPNQSTDMTYAGSLPGTNLSVQTMDHISSKNLVYAVLYDGYSQVIENEIKIFSGDFLNALGSKPIPGFLVKQADHFQLVASEGMFGFFNAAGTKFFVCSRSTEIPGAPVQWAIATINVD